MYIVRGLIPRRELLGSCSCVETLLRIGGSLDILCGWILLIRYVPSLFMTYLKGLNSFFVDSISAMERGDVEDTYDNQSYIEILVSMFYIGYQKSWSH